MLNNRIGLIYDSWAKSYDEVPNLTLRVLQRGEADFYKRINDLLGAPSGARILDVGTGTGRYLHYLLRPGAQLICVDIAADMLRIAQAKHSQHAQIQFVTTDFLNFHSHKKFNYINSSLSLMHFADLEGYFIKCAELCEVEGLVGINCCSEQILDRGLRPHFQQNEIDYFVHRKQDILSIAEKVGFKCRMTEDHKLHPADIFSPKHEKYLNAAFITSWIFQRTSEKSVP